MILYLDEDAAYLAWLAHHHAGFVVDWLRKPSRRRPTLHRASCPKMRLAKSRKTHWTTGRRLKACSLDQAELVAWAEQESGRSPADCEVCAPRDELAPGGTEPRAVTKLGMDMLDYVVEVALIHLDNEHTDYSLNLGDVAAYVDKSMGQIAAAVQRLVESGLLRVEKNNDSEVDWRSEHLVFPTCEALKMLPAFENVPIGEIESELAGLDHGRD